MFDFNSPLAGLIVRIIGVVILSICLVFQFRANAQHQDEFTSTRILLTVLISGVIIFTAPTIGYLSIIALGEESELLRNVSIVSGSISSLFVSVLLLVLYLQKVQKHK